MSRLWNCSCLVCGFANGLRDRGLKGSNKENLRTSKRIPSSILGCSATKERQGAGAKVCSWLPCWSRELFQAVIQPKPLTAAIPAQVVSAALCGEMGWELIWLLKIAHGNGSSELGPGPGRVPLALSPKEMLLVLHAAVIAAALLPQSNQGLYVAKCLFSRQKPEPQACCCEKRARLVYILQHRGLARVGSWSNAVHRWKCLVLGWCSAVPMGLRFLHLIYPREVSSEVESGFQADKDTGKLTTVCPGPYGE